ncbi:MAG TPA: cytochrome c biogenesis protein CcdA [Mycobacteriales bacterium]|nr:cytochrome c biogenesis protein CcdA [Mycobacteriales bacterium]
MSVADTFVATVTDGPLLLALPVAAAAGLVSFLSPCVLPLVPGYLSYVTGLSGAELGDDRRPQPVVAPAAPSGDLRPAAGDAPPEPQGLEDHRGATVQRGRVLAGSLLFVAGFSAVFVTSGAFFGYLGSELLQYRAVLDRVLGALVVVLGLSFLGLLPQLQRTVKLSWLPSRGLLGAPLLGVLFGVGWTPCLGPTLAAVQTLAYTQASAGRGAVLTAAYCVGLGLPFVLTGLAFRRALGAFDVVKRHYRLVMRVGGGLLVVVGLLLLSGLWETAMAEVRGWVAGFETVV